jgi:hypothetical protein
MCCNRRCLHVATVLNYNQAFYGSGGAAIAKMAEASKPLVVPSSLERRLAERGFDSKMARVLFERMARTL